MATYETGNNIPESLKNEDGRLRKKGERKDSKAKWNKLGNKCKTWNERRARQTKKGQMMRETAGRGGTRTFADRDSGEVETAKWLSWPPPAVWSALCSISSQLTRMHTLTDDPPPSYLGARPQSLALRKKKKIYTKRNCWESVGVTVGWIHSDWRRHRQPSFLSLDGAVDQGGTG